MARVDLRGQREKARSIAEDNMCSTGGTVAIGLKSGIADDPGDSGDRTTHGLQHYDTGLVDIQGHLQDGHTPRGRPGQKSVTRNGRHKQEDPALDLARPGSLDVDHRYANAGTMYDWRQDGAGSKGQ